MMYDNDAFKKWDELNKYFLYLCLKQSKVKREIKISSFFIKVIKNILENCYQDPAFAAELLSVPSENEIAENAKTYNPENIYLARNSIIKNINSSLKVDFIRILEQSSLKKNSSLRGWRALHNVCLEYLTAKKDKNSEELAYKAYNSSNNMTIKLYSLSCICNMKGKYKTRLISEFYQQYKEQPIMIEKWFQVQASAKTKNNLNTVKRLIKLPDFDYKNPNRSSQMTFAKNNSINFHHSSGAGYKFIAIKLYDSINPVLVRTCICI